MLLHDSRRVTCPVPTLVWRAAKKTEDSHKHNYQAKPPPKSSLCFTGPERWTCDPEPGNEERRWVLLFQRWMNMWTANVSLAHTMNHKCTRACVLVYVCVCACVCVCVRSWVWMCACVCVSASAVLCIRNCVSYTSLKICIDSLLVNNHF